MGILMIPAIIRQASLLKLSQLQPDYHRFLHDRIDFNERLIGVKGARGSGKTTRFFSIVRKRQ